MKHFLTIIGISLIICSIIVGVILYFVLPRREENWCNDYSGEPGPIENVTGLYNIPVLWDVSPRFRANFWYKDNPRSALNYKQLDDFPKCG